MPVMKHDPSLAPQFQPIRPLDPEFKPPQNPEARSHRHIYVPYQIVESIGSPSCTHRILVFKAQDGPYLKRYSYAGAASIFRYGTIYDWHGRLVADFSSDIAEVVKLLSHDYCEDIYAVRVESADETTGNIYRLAALRFVDADGYCITGRLMRDISYSEFRAGHMRLEAFTERFDADRLRNIDLYIGSYAARSSLTPKR